MSLRKRWSCLPWVAKIHDLGVCIWSAKLFFEGQTGPALALLGWFSLIWLLRIFDFANWLDWTLPEGIGIVLMTFATTMLLEGFLVWLYWKEAVDYIVSHY